MATNTTNYNFKKPDESDFYSVQDQNNNWDKADAALKDLDTPTFEDYSGSATVPDAATAIGNIKSKGKLSTTFSNIKAALKGACLIGQIINNCVTDNAKLPLSAAQGKALMDLYTKLNSDLGNYMPGSSTFSSWVSDPDTVNTPFALLNGWSAQLQHAPEGLYQHWGVLITLWNARSEIGDLSKPRTQCVMFNSVTQTRYFSGDTKKWSAWGAS